MEAKEVRKKLDRFADRLTSMLEDETIIGFAKEIQSFKSDFEDFVGEIQEEGIQVETGQSEQT